MTDKDVGLKEVMLGVFNAMLLDVTKEWREVKDKRIKDLTEEIRAWKKNNRLAQKDVLRLKELVNGSSDVLNRHMFETNAERHEHNILIMQYQQRILALEERIRTLEEKKQ